MAEPKMDDGNRAESSLRDEIARRVAAKLAPEVGPKLPVYVERLIALGDDALDEAPVQRMDGASAAALASIVMQAIGIALIVVHRREDEQRRRAEEQHGEDEQRRKEEQDRVLRLAESAVALAREARASEIRAAIQDGVKFPEEVRPKVRIALVESVVEESLVEEKCLEAKR